MSESIKFNIIIPTRERSDTLIHSLRTVVNQDYENLNIIVSDNFSQDNTREVVDSFNDPRIIYYNTGKRLSMSHNWEFALSKVNDGWVSIIGDDDGLLPGCLYKVAELIKKTKALAIRSNVCSYLWPDVNQYKKWRFSVPIKSGFEVRNSGVWLSKVLKGNASYPELPMLYNGGFICSSLIKKIKHIYNGTFYQSSAPDIFSSIALASIIKNYIYSHEPFAINGASRHSTGTSGINSGYDTKNSPIKKFFSEENIPFHPDIPICTEKKYPLPLQVAVYESYLKTSNLRDRFSKNHHRQQLGTILAIPERHEFYVKQWGQKFASIHGLDYFKIESEARRKRIFLKLACLPKKLSLILDMYVMDANELPLNNVYEASIAGAKIRDTMPSQIENIRHLPWKIIEHFRRKWHEKKITP
ncbi:glycosyltransferase family 2 protein [Desulfobacula sp.]|uniref:glycosyltransferase family 2 protein n=1 Tax=Desulfobacula sp. TaxID=2593537 RepID=UPI002618CE22|nr:glycosyltransferase family 2 protein [Desulfobacula sp.]